MLYLITSLQLCYPFHQSLISSILFLLSVYILLSVCLTFPYISLCVSVMLHSSLCLTFRDTETNLAVMQTQTTTLTVATHTYCIYTDTHYTLPPSQYASVPAGAPAVTSIRGSRSPVSTLNPGQHSQFSHQSLSKNTGRDAFAKRPSNPCPTLHNQYAVTEPKLTPY